VKRFLPALLVVLLLAVMPGAEANHSWGNYHWGRTANPFQLKIVDSVTGVWDSLLPPVSADWSASSAFDTSIESGGSGLIARLLCNPISGKIRVCNANYGPNLWFGLATVYVSGGHISQAVTQLNDFYFTGSYANNIARRHVLCQEVGHDFGLDHQHGVPTCMEDNNSTLNNPSYLSPNSHDYAQLVTIYSHLDSVNTSSAQSAPKRLQPSRVEQVGNQTVLTYILWAR
jgi:hypothetical protein